MAEVTEPHPPAAIPQHTPGPWHRCEAQPDAIVGPRCEPGTCQFCDRSLSAGGRTDGEFYGGHFVCESVGSPANYALITGAPDLLAAAEDVLDFLEGYVLDDEDDATYDRLSAVVARIRGRTS
jgi:hypothetical protein